MKTSISVSKKKKLSKKELEEKLFLKYRETNEEIKPTYKGITKYPLYKSPPTKEELDKCKFVPVRVWIFKNYYAIAQIDNSIIVYLCSSEIPTINIDNFNELNYYMLKEKTYPYKNELALEKIIMRVSRKKLSSYNKQEEQALKKNRRKQQWE